MSENYSYLEVHQTGSRSRPSSPKIDIEVIIDDLSTSGIDLRLCEDSPIQTVPKKGIRIVSVLEEVAVLRLTEDRAIELNLV